jgi:hypothetical protein
MAGQGSVAQGRAGRDSVAQERTRRDRNGQREGQSKAGQSRAEQATLEFSARWRCQCLRPATDQPVAKHCLPAKRQFTPSWRPASGEAKKPLQRAIARQPRARPPAAEAHLASKQGAADYGGREPRIHSGWRDAAQLGRALLLAYREPDAHVVCLQHLRRVVLVAQRLVVVPAPTRHTHARARQLRGQARLLACLSGWLAARLICHVSTVDRRAG